MENYELMEALNNGADFATLLDLAGVDPSELTEEGA